MINKKLLEIIRALSKPQQKRLRLFLESPYFNHGYNKEVIIALYAYIQKYKSDPKHAKLQKQLVSEQFFPKKVFREKEKNTIDSLCSDLFLLVRKFISIESQETTYARERELLALATFSRKHGFDDRFNQTIEALEKILDETEERDSEYYLLRHRVNIEVFQFESLFTRNSEGPALLTAEKNLDLFFSAVKIELICSLEYLVKWRRFDANLEPSPITEALFKSIEEDPLFRIPHNEIFKQIRHLLHHPEEQASILNLENLLDTHKSELTHESMNNMQVFLRMFKTRTFFTKGQSAGMQELFTLYEQHLNDGYFELDGKLHINAFRLLIIVALRVGKIQWAEKVLIEYPPERLSGSRYTQEFHNICRAEVLFYKGDYSGVDKFFSYRLFENTNLSILADVLLLKIYYETNNELYFPRLMAIDRKIRRAKISLDRKEAYLHFIQIMDKIGKLGYKPSEKKKKKLLEAIQSSQNIIERDWLLEKINSGRRPKGPALPAQ